MTDEIRETHYVGLGSIVEFRPKVYKAPYAPHYDAYKGHTFQVVAVHEGDHIELKCLDDKSIIVAGYIHEDEITYGKLP
jgi:hypothetical protein